MPKLQLKNIQEHLQFLIGERKPFTESDHLEKTYLYITKQFENFNLSVNKEAVYFKNSSSFNIIGKPTDIPVVMATNTAFFHNPYYHQSTDTLKTLDIEFIRKNTEAVGETLKTLLQKKLVA
jgi:hypothetical protein